MESICHQSKFKIIEFDIWVLIAVKNWNADAKNNIQKTITLVKIIFNIFLLKSEILESNFDIDINYMFTI